jgi:cell division septation protein DedD
MKKNAKIVLFIYFILGVSLFSQNLDKNWRKIVSDDSLEIFVDSSKVVSYGTDVSVWAVEKFRTPKYVNAIGKVSAIKTHYLFDKVKRRYVEIGKIYYDKRGGIVNRASSSSGFASGPSPFKKHVSTDANVQNIFNEVISYLIIGKFSSSNSRTKKKNIKSTIPKDFAPPPIKVDTLEDADKKNIAENEIPALETYTIEKTTESVKKTNTQEKTYPEPNAKKDTSESYNIAEERGLKNAIFTDGNLYCVQVSSWKTRAYAERELNKLLSHGYNAFIVSVKPKHKRSIWHRVRVGYFTSLQKAKTIQRQIKRITK